MCFIVKQDYEAKYMNNEPTLLTVNPVSALKQQVIVSGDSEILKRNFKCKISKNSQASFTKMGHFLLLIILLKKPVRQ